MPQMVKTLERRTCSKSAPFIYFALESMAILLVIYILTGGDIFSKYGLIMVFFGLFYPVLKLPIFVKRAFNCRRYQDTASATEGIRDTFVYTGYFREVD